VPPWENIGTTYDYRDAGGDLVLQVIRTLTGQPRFLQRAPDPSSRSGWKYSVKHIPDHDCLLYRLPGLRASGDVPVLIPEGEKDVDRLHDEGQVATCNIGGAGKWRPEYAEQFRDKHVVVLADNDQAGRDHAAAVARSLIGIAASVKVLSLPGLPEKGDVSDWLDNNGTIEELMRLAGEAEEFTSPDADEPPPGDAQLAWATIRQVSAIPPRRWAYGRFLLFGSAAVIGAVDGAGKGMIATVMALAMISGRPLLGEKVWRTGPVAIITYEDDQEEWERRFAAACLLYELDYMTMMKSVAFLHKPNGRVTLAERTKDGLNFPDTARIVHFLKAHGFVLLIIDPFNSAHAMDDGNNNVAIAAVAQEVTTIAHRGILAVLVLHHLRKGSTGSIDDLMGATSLRANFRSCRIIQGMDGPTAIGFDLPAAEAWRYLWVAGTTENYAPPVAERIWFHKQSIDLGNPGGIYTTGDSVGAIERWTPPAAYEGMDHDRMRAVFDALAAQPHAKNQRASIPWAGKPLMNAGRTEVQAKKILADWLQSDTLIPGEEVKGESRHPVQTVMPNPTKVASILAALGGGTRWEAARA
jgi:hypothetical protein